VRIPPRIGKWLGGLAGAAALVLLATGPAAAAIPVGQPMSGEMTYYNDVGYGACGTPIDASTQYLVAVSYQWWTTANPNNDPLCQGISVQVGYNGRTVTLPVVDKCPTCDATHIDLSQPAFEEFAPTGTGVITGITWEFVSSGGGSTPPPLGAPTGLHVTGTTSSSVSLSWSGVAGAASYTVYRGGTQVGTTSGTTFTDTGLSAATSYTYTVAATGTGGTGALSSPVTATTAAGGGGGTGCPAAWNPSTSYVPGDTVSYNGHAYKATYYSTGAVPSDPSSWAVWSDQGAC